MSGVTVSNDLMETWEPEGASREAAEGLLEIAKARHAVPRHLAQGMINGDNVGGDVMVGILSARSALPHVDSDSPPWSALWVLQAGVGHRLSMADHVPSGTSGMGRIPPTKPHFHAELTAGSVTLFNGHRLHWVKPADDKGMLVAAGIDFYERPTREEVEERIEEIVRGYDLAAASPRP